jgi:hypothetical protein
MPEIPAFRNIQKWTPPVSKYVTGGVFVSN